MIQRGLVVAAFFVQPAERVMNQRQRAPALIGQIAGRCRGVFQNANCFVEESGAGEIVGQVQSRLQIAGRAFRR